MKLCLEKILLLHILRKTHKTSKKCLSTEKNVKNFRFLAANDQLLRLVNSSSYCLNMKQETILFEKHQM